MSFLPDPGELDALADRITRQAAAARVRAQRLGAAVAAVNWHGAAADAFRAEAHAVICGLHSAAGRLDDAAAALRRHAHKVGAIIDELRALGVAGLDALEDAVTDPGELLSDGTKLVAGGAGLVGDALGLVGF